MENSKKVGKAVVKYDNLEDLQKTNILNLAIKLLESTVESTGILKVGKMTVEKIQQSKLVLGFLNASNKIMLTKIQLFKLTNVKEKVVAIRKHGKLLK